MPDTNPQETLDTKASGFRLNRLEAAWRTGDPPPDWQQHLPADEETCSPDLIFDLLRMDIEYRIKAGMSALLAEHYFDHPRLQKEDARLESEQQMQLIRWEYQQRWDKGEPARRAEYEAVFPQHADAVRELKPHSRCPRCRKVFVLEETYQTRYCPTCDSASPSINAGPHPEFDVRGYQLIEQLGKGGMGEVYRCGDPALGRDLAIKVMRAESCGHAVAERRFLREARVTGSLQHPGIVPVYNLGRLSDGRLHYTMRLVRGDAFADILKNEAGKAERLPDLLTIFEKICQAVAYAHSKRVIHRDLKPHNVMVGKFGEVQVMDWGLAKLLTSDDDDAESEETMDVVGTRIFTEPADTPVDLSRVGVGLGTLPYMPSEQARGKWNLVDERADVFALGSILCEILTGQPAYIGSSISELCDRVERGDVAEALQRLQHCGADTALTALCRECLSPHRDDRPRDAAGVAKRVAEYQADVQERLRNAELERVAAEARANSETERAREALARAKAERRAKKRTLALAAAVMLLITGGGVGLWLWHLKQEQSDREALALLERAGKRLEEGWQQQDLNKLMEVKAEAERAADVARSGSASDTVSQQVADFRTKVQEHLARAEKNRELLNALLDVATPHETKTYQATGLGQTVMTLAEPTVEEQYAAAFRRRWPDVDFEKQAASDVVARLREEPEAVLQFVIAGLDGWIVERRRQQPEAEWRRLLGLVERLDPSEHRRQLRIALTGTEPPPAASMVGLLAARPPWPALWELARGNDWRRLRQVRNQMNAAAESGLTLLLLARASIEVGDMVSAEEVLRLALAQHPDEVSLLDALGKVLERQGRLSLAIGCYRAARAKHPRLGISLGVSLGKVGQPAEGEAILRDLARRNPKNPEMVFYLGNALYSQRKHVEAELAYRKAIALKPDYSEAYGNLGNALNAQGKHKEAESACRKVIALKPDSFEAYNNLGIALSDQGKNMEAEVVYRRAIALKPDLAETYHNLFIALNDQGKHIEAETSCRKAIKLNPNHAAAYNNLAIALGSQGKLAEAEATCGKAIALEPNFGEAYYNLGNVLSLQWKHMEAELAYRKAITFKPDYPEAYGNLGNALRLQGRFTESLAAYRRGHELGSKQPGWRYPSLQWVREAERMVELEKKTVDDPSRQGSARQT